MILGISIIGLGLVVACYCFSFLLPNSRRAHLLERPRPATQAQRDYIKILGGTASSRLTVVQASRMIDELIERREQRRMLEAEERAQKRIQEKAEAKLSRDHNRLMAKRKKAEIELQTLAGAMNDPAYKPKKSRSYRVQNLREFQHLVNRIISDGVFEPREILEVKEWLESHRLHSDEFADTLAVIEKVLSDGAVTDSEASCFYNKILDTIIELGNRPV